MVAKASGIDSVFVRVVPTTPMERERSRLTTSSGDDELRRTAYTALVYSQLPVPVTSFADPPTGQPAVWSGDPLLGGETFVVNWSHYSDYAAAYFEGEKDASMMQERLFEALPRNLSAILSGEFGGSRPTRTWFHSDAPEVSQLPWELVAYANRHRLQAGGSFVRGIPPETATPLVPVVGRLRIGIVDPGGRIAPTFGQVLAGFGADLEVVPLSGGVRAALRQAVEQGIELLHAVAAASVTTSYDGVLEFPGSDEPPIASSEIASLLRGSRVRLVGLTPPAGDPSAASQGPYLAPSAYRAFTYFATSPYPLPSFVVPVGPMDDRQVLGFWSVFYRALAASFEIETAMTDALRQGIVPVGLFLRQLQAATFKHVSEAEQPATEPSIVGAELATSTELLRQYEHLSSNLGFKSPTFDKLVKKEQKRQSRLAADVSEWIEGVHEE
jgi:hypothetical protein